MKKTKTILYPVVLGMMLLSVSCASNKLDSGGQNRRNQDEKKSGKKLTDYQGGLIEELDFSDEDFDFVLEKNKKNGFINGLGTSGKFCEYDGAKIYTTTAFGSLKETEAVMVFVPESETFGFGSPYLAAYYYVHFDEKGRSAFIKAVNQYFKDFENKRLSRDDKKTTYAYGSTDGYVNWGTIKSSCPNNGIGKISFGYKFVNKFPYFTISFSSIYNKKSDNDSVAPRESLNATYCLTKSFAKHLVRDLSDGAVTSVLNDYNGFSNYEYEEDEYYEEISSETKDSAFSGDEY